MKHAGKNENIRAYNDAIADVFWTLLNSSEFALNH